MLKISRKEAAAAASSVVVRSKVLWYHRDEVDEQLIHIRESVIAQSMYRVQSLDLERAARYAARWIVIGDDMDSVDSYLFEMA